ncbi:MAG: phosphoribosyltransferase family protein, partial [Eubacterium sp.]|nr:phosphoribosyltransferase family protein [Eubacterium sp.]
EELARYVAQALKIPVMESALIRLQNTRPQNQLNDKQRRNNLKDAFEVPASAVAQIQGKRILLMDDIYTTGATLEACGSALRQAGAEDIYFACLCTGREEPV